MHSPPRQHNACGFIPAALVLAGIPVVASPLATSYSGCFERPSHSAPGLAAEADGVSEQR